MARILIVYHSRSGYTRRVAQALAGRLAADLEGVEVVQPLEGALGYAMCAIEAVTGLAPALRPVRKNPADYDLVLIGTPIWFWSLSSPMRSWLEQHPLPGRKFAFFCTMGESGASCVFATMKQLAGGEPIATLALTDTEIDEGSRAKLDAFVDTMRTGPRPRSRRPGSRAATAAPRPTA